MASSYDISGGSDTILLEGAEPDKEYAGVQVVQTSLDAQITIKLQQTNEGTQFHDLPESPVKMKTTTNSVLLQTTSFELTNLYIDIDVGSATTGTLNFYTVSRD